MRLVAQITAAACFASTIAIYPLSAQDKPAADELEECFTRLISLAVVASNGHQNRLPIARGQVIEILSVSDAIADLMVRSWPPEKPDKRLEYRLRRD
jgi:hypothetical protein